MHTHLFGRPVFLRKICLRARKHDGLLYESTVRNLMTWALNATDDTAHTRFFGRPVFLRKICLRARKYCGLQYESAARNLMALAHNMAPSERKLSCD